MLQFNAGAYLTPVNPAEADLGYRFNPACAHDDPCHRQLSVCLAPAPTRRHYDPEMVLCQIVSAVGDPEALEIRHPWPFDTSYRLFPGRIVLLDRVGKQVEAFAFGGELEEVVLAERRAHWEMRGALHEFQARLGAMPPFTVYLTCLEAVAERLQPMVRAGSGQARQIMHFVERERGKLQAAGLWPPYVASVDEAL